MNKRKHPLDVRTGARSLGQRKLAKDGTTWTPTEARTRDRLLRQFQRTGRKGSNVSSGASQEYRDGWDRIWGGKG